MKQNFCFFILLFLCLFITGCDKSESADSDETESTEISETSIETTETTEEVIPLETIKKITAIEKNSDDSEETSFLSNINLIISSTFKSMLNDKSETEISVKNTDK